MRYGMGAFEEVVPDSNSVEIERQVNSFFIFDGGGNSGRLRMVIYEFLLYSMGDNEGLLAEDKLRTGF